MPRNIDENEIFKSLSHEIRRDILRIIGRAEKLGFSEIKRQVNDIESPNLSYHLKSLDPLVISEENKYQLSDIGKAAYKLLLMTDESETISKYKKRFLYAYVATILCWIIVQTMIPIIIGVISKNAFPALYTIIIIILNVVGVINFILVWKLKEID